MTADKASRTRFRLFVGARLVTLVFFLLTSFYCLLAYIPYTYFAFIQAPFQAWLPALFRYHHLFYWPVIALAAASVWPDARRPVTRRLVAGFVLFHVAAGLYFLKAQPFGHLHNDSLSFLWSLAAFLPLVWLAAIDVEARRGEKRWPESWQRSPLPLSTAALAGAAVAVVYAAVSHLRYAVVTHDVAFWGEQWLLSGWSVVAHVLFFLLLFCGLSLGGAIARTTRSPGLVKFAVDMALLWVVLVVFFRTLVLEAISFAGSAAWIYSAAVSFTLVAVVGGLRMRHGAAPAPKPARNVPPAEKALIALILVAAAYAVPALIGNFDWDFLFQKLWALAFWAAVLVLLVRLRPRSAAKAYSLPMLVVVAASSLAVYAGAVSSQTLWPRLMGHGKVDIHDTLNHYSNFDVSFKVIRDELSASQPRCDDFCRYLEQNTNIPSSESVSPADVDLVADLKPTTAHKPNIFIFVIDSLRQDYVSAYNPRVDFTPELGKFAAESVVMHNAFTRYAGTALSEPSIWSGSLQIHKHFVQPYYPMNSLEKLIETDDYDSYVDVDTILHVLLKPDSKLRPLDPGVGDWTGYDLCSTVQGLERRLDARRDRCPVFFYSQPVNIHLVTLRKLGDSRPPRRAYPGFQPLYASELERLDGCFGNFVDYLKARGLYDDSVVVVTADHGEEMGEEGNVNHAYGLRPEILRIPLIVHVPPDVRRSYAYDPESIAFTIDITPTLYYLLGHRPIVNNELYGRPLFTLTRDEQAQYLRPGYLVGSSYGAVYGILGDNGRTLYIEDDVNFSRRFYDLGKDPMATNNLVIDQVRRYYQAQIRSGLDAIAGFYHFKPTRDSLLQWMTR